MVAEASIRAVCESGVSLMFQVYCFFFHHAIIVIKLAMANHVATSDSDLSAGPQLNLPPGSPPLT